MANNFTKEQLLKIIKDEEGDGCTWCKKEVAEGYFLKIDSGGFKVTICLDCMRDLFEILHKLWIDHKNIKVLIDGAGNISLPEVRDEEKK